MPPPPLTNKLFLPFKKNVHPFLPPAAIKPTHNTEIQLGNNPLQIGAVFVLYVI